MAEEITYTEAFKELLEIIKAMENSEVTIDHLDTKIQKASELLKICKDKLYSTEKKVQKILDDINNYTIGDSQ